MAARHTFKAIENSSMTKEVKRDGFALWLLNLIKRGGARDEEHTE